MNEEMFKAFESDILRPVLLNLGALTNEIESKFEKPKEANLGGFLTWRYEKPQLEHIVIQRLYRIISGLKSSYILLGAGHIQEVGVVLRTVNEFQQDIVFLIENYGTAEPSPHQKKFVEENLKEGYKDVSIPFKGAPVREMIPRKKILAAIARTMGLDGNLSDAQKLSEIDTDIFGGFVHGSYPNIMDMYGHHPTKKMYHPFGVRSEQINKTWTDQILIYLERAIHKVLFVAHAFGLPETQVKAYAIKKRFSKEAQKYGYSLDFKTKDPMADLKKGKPLE